ncbi:ATP-dependent Clp protease proteolytic subunit [Mycolicibacterium septicum]|uniref:ATP-dependent Clp protease proteolytic subunit n=1 Tax=Mycolicibacterium septicum TaxID=98668 RepID=UPI001AF213B8|nr:ATP-dependent Clp protease proteolytic subunit [Mycolicibacterium septicum]QRY51781.1 ATP-dependent Clp protease proteolytic subunit [Mycolicibacterium septicum]
MTETEYCAAQLDKIRAETRFILAQAVREEQEAVIAGIDRQERELEQIRALSEINTYHFRADFNEESVNDCIDTLNEWHNLAENSAWNICLNSPGGYLDYGLHLFDDLVAHSIRGGGTHHITITARGMAASMGSILLQAADKRVVGKYSHILIHQLSAGAFGTIGDLRDSMGRFELWNEQIIDIYMERAKMSRKKFVQAWERTDWWLSADEAVALGFADRIG